ncbi:MAG TPA: hypothetical protein VGX48_03485 [Pyrinomonadaceae bacterium]|nr:hypothetical protein [Pyrinomonadaceae bacterium]
MQNWAEIHEPMAYEVGMSAGEVETMLEGLELFKRCARGGQAEWPVWACWAVKQ